MEESSLAFPLSNILKQWLISVALIPDGGGAADVSAERERAGAERLLERGRTEGAKQ